MTSRFPLCVANSVGFYRNGPNASQRENTCQDADQELDRTGVLQVPVALESQTQEETQALPADVGHCESKRKMSGGTCEDSAKKTKKIKISLGPPVDLGD